jgi:hypothetical protein
VEKRRGKQRPNRASHGKPAGPREAKSSRDQAQLRTEALAARRDRGQAIAARGGRAGALSRPGAGGGAGQAIGRTGQVGGKVGQAGGRVRSGAAWRSQAGVRER